MEVNQGFKINKKACESGADLIKIQTYNRRHYT